MEQIILNSLLICIFSFALIDAIFSYQLGNSFIYTLNIESHHELPLTVLHTNKKTQQQQRLKQQETNRIKIELEKLQQERFIFTDPNLSLKTLADYIDSTPNDLSWYLNNCAHISFHDYVNTIRVELFIKRIEQKAHKGRTLISIAYSVGFSSKSTFNRSFKKVMSMTPSAFVKQYVPSGDSPTTLLNYDWAS